LSHPDQTGVIQSIRFLNKGIFVCVSIECAGNSRQRIAPLNRVGRKSTSGATSGVGGDEVSQDLLHRFALALGARKSGLISGVIQIDV
jgi:hypothetical protein